MIRVEWGFVVGGSAHDQMLPRRERWVEAAVIRTTYW
jgi:hypothetical protein